MQGIGIREQGTDAAPTRPVLRYHGGKWNLAPWLIAQMPPHRVYVEPFGGGANVLLRKPRAGAECYNDLDGAVVRVFRALQDPEKAVQIRRRLALTPFARAEFDRTYEPPVDDVDEVCKIIARSFMGRCTDSVTRSCRTGFRVSDGRALPSAEWAGWPSQVPLFVDRLRGVVIENRDAMEILARFDSEGTLFYIDPPYVGSTRSSLEGRSKPTHGYRHELTDIEHRGLAGVLGSLRGMVLLSGYRCELYDELYAGWVRRDRDTLADGARKRVESLWLNDAAVRAQKPTLWSVR